MEYKSNGHQFFLIVYINYLVILYGLSVEKKKPSVNQMPPFQATLALNLQMFLHQNSVPKYSFVTVVEMVKIPLNFHGNCLPLQ